MSMHTLNDPDALFRENWRLHLHHGADATPTLPVRHVAEAGPRLWVLDLRSDTALTGAQGHIPGVHRAPSGGVASLSGVLSPTAPLVLVCSDGEEAARAARTLASKGFTTVAAMSGGMTAWRAAGYAVSRDPAVVKRHLSALSAGHGADGRPLKVLHDGGHLSADAIEAHVGTPSRVRRVKLASILMASQTSCVDGREDRGVLGTPGGDAGELVLALAATERAAGSAIDTDRVATLTRAFADAFGGIYLHTDNGALGRLVSSIQSDPRLQAHVAELRTDAAWVDFLTRPPAEARPTLLEHAVQREHVGCGHLKLALGDSSGYHVRSELITAFFRAFYTDLWSGAPHLSWVILGSGHAEGAVVNVTVAGEVHPGTPIPLVAPCMSGVQMFVNHPQAVAFLRQQTARFMTHDVANLVPGGSGLAARLPPEMDELAAVQMGATLTALAKGLPLYEVQFEGDAITVSAGGAVA